MLTLRTNRLYSRLPKSTFGCFVEPGCSAFSVDCIPRSRFHPYKDQTRHYLFLPVSFPEAKERLQRWLERTESRIVKVSLLTRRKQNATSNASDNLQKRRKPDYFLLKQRKSKRKLKKWKSSRKSKLYIQNQLQRISFLPLPSPKSHATLSKVAEMRNTYEKWKLVQKSQYQLWKDSRKEQYQGWKSRRQAQYKGWKSRRTAQYQGWKSRRQAQYQRWNMKRNREWIKRKQVLLEEYSESEWFDALGRPLTARDSTGRFVNPWQSQSTNGVHSLETILRWRWQRLLREKMSFISNFIFPTMRLNTTNTYSSTSPLLTQTVPPLPVPNESSLHFTWIGHSTCLFQVKKNFSIITDPMFSTRASPFKNFIGVQRDVPPAYSIQDLISHQTRHLFADDMNRNQRSDDDGFGRLDLCCITHDHYDHMDTASVKDLRRHVQLWVVPLGIGEWLEKSCSIDPRRIVELQWWQQVRVCKTKGKVVVLISGSSRGKSFAMDEHNKDEVLTITCCPSSHWAGRSAFDRNQRLWSSFSFSSSSFKFFFCGDSGYPKFPLFRQIGDTLGPFDLSCIPIGAYEPREMNKDSHCNPHEAVQIHKDLHSKHSVAIHWGSFQLTEELMGAPPQDLEEAIRIERLKDQDFNKNNVSTIGNLSYPSINFSVLGHGETLVLNDE